MNDKQGKTIFAISNGPSKPDRSWKKSFCWLALIVALTWFFLNIYIMAGNYVWKTNETEDSLVDNKRHKFIVKKNVNEKKERKPSKLFSPIHATAAKSISVEVVSSGDHASVSIDGRPVYEDDRARGIHLVVLNQYNAAVMASKVFDTFYPGIENYMAEYLSSLRKGMLLVFTVRDEASLHLKRVGRSALKSLGSRYIDKIGWRDTWVFVCQKDVRWINEKLNKSPNDDAYGETAKIRDNITLDSMSEKCNWGDSPLEIKRSQFCSKYVGYGEICNCNNPAELNLVAPILMGNRASLAPITVIASNRPEYLYQMMSNFLVTPGVDKNMITVYVDGFYDEVMALLDLFGVKAVEHLPACSLSCRIHQSYKLALGDTFKKHPEAEFIIILEEDLKVSEDIMDYFAQMLPVLFSDESVYCISAWNDNGFRHSSNDPAMAYRVETMPGLGWILKRTLWEEIRQHWPDVNYPGDWDLWMRTPEIRKQRECIIPDISRTFHLGKIGVHQNSYIIHRYNETLFANLNNQTGNIFDTAKLTKQSYEKNVRSLIKNAKILDHTKNPCTDADFIPNTHGKTYVMYIKWSFKGDHQTWINLAQCFHLWWYDVRGVHKLMWRFWLKKNHVFVVGSNSPYSMYKPKNVNPIVITDAMIGRKNDFDMLLRQGYKI